jgi:hypothetical protein
MARSSYEATRSAGDVSVDTDIVTSRHRFAGALVIGKMNAVVRGVARVANGITARSRGGCLGLDPRATIVGAAASTFHLSIAVNVAMNYFAHGRHFVDDPYFLAGTAVPDWLSVVDRKVRARSKLAAKLVDDKDERVAAIARGVVQHHHDDAWFHQTRAFAELSLDFTVTIRDLLAPDDGFRPSFLGHILVEILLDAALIAERPQRLDAYYQALHDVSPQVVNDAVKRMTVRQTDLLTALIPRFSAEQFLYDYADDAKLLMRLNHVMNRVRLPQLPDALSSVFSEARQKVSARKTELLAGETTSDL